MKYKQTERLPWRNIEDRSVIINPKTGQVHELDQVASFLWAQADGNKSVQEIATLLADAFDVEIDEALVDSKDFYSNLESLGLVTCQS